MNTLACVPLFHADEPRCRTAIVLPSTVEYPLPVGYGGGNYVAPFQEMLYDAHRLTQRHTVLSSAHRLASPPLVLYGPYHLALPRAVFWQCSQCSTSFRSFLWHYAVW